MSCKITIAEKKKLEKKSKVGWGMYFKEKEENHKLIEENYQLIKKLKNLSESKGGNQKLPSNIIEEINELYSVMKRKVECPICYEEMASGDFVLSSCNCKVKYCKSCYDKIDKCAICNYKYSNK